MPDDDAALELRSTPDDETIREGLRRAYRPYVYLVLSLFIVLVPPLTALRAWLDDAWLVRTLLALVVMGVGVWSTGRALRSLVQSGLEERSGKEVVLPFRRAQSGRVRETRLALIVSGPGIGPIVLARRDVTDALLARLRARR